MTVQYQEENINGQPAPLSLRIVPTAVAIPVVGPNSSSLYLPTAVADAVITGSGITIEGDATTGNLYTFSQPGLFRVAFTSTDASAAGLPMNILRGATVGTIGAPLYPWPDFVGFPSPGIVSVGFNRAAGDVLGQTFTTEAFVRMSNADLADPAGGGINPNRQVVIAVDPAVAAALLPFAAIEVAIDRVSL